MIKNYLYKTQKQNKQDQYTLNSTEFEIAIYIYFCTND